MAFETFSLPKIAGAAQDMRTSQVRNALFEQELQRNNALAQREAQFNALMGDYLQGDQGNVNQMLALNPAATQDIVGFQNSQNELAREQEMEQAATAVRSAQFVLNSQSPKRLLTTAFPEFVEQLNEQGVSVSELSDDQVRTMAQGLIEHYAPTAGMSPVDVTGEPDPTLVEVADPTSPTGTRLIPRAEAAGMPGKPPSGMSVTVGPDGTVQLSQGRAGATKPPSGYRYTEEGTLEPIPGGPATKVSGEMAGKLAGAQQALSQDIPFIIEKAFEGGSLDGEFLQSSVLGSKKGIVPFTQGFGETREINQAVSRAVTALLRLESGAATPDPEIVRYETEQYGLSAFDNSDSARAKINALKTRFENAIANVKGQPIKAETASAQGGPQPGAVEDGYRFLGGDPADPNSWERVN